MVEHINDSDTGVYIDIYKKAMPKYTGFMIILSDVNFSENFDHTKTMSSP